MEYLMLNLPHTSKPSVIEFLMLASRWQDISAPKRFQQQSLIQHGRNKKAEELLQDLSDCQISPRTSLQYLLQEASFEQG